MSSRSDGPVGARGESRLVQQAVARAKAGDSEGLHFLYVRYADDVLRHVLSFVRDRDEAEDITQKVFAKLMSAIEQYEQRDVSFTAWILRVARNASLDHLRARRDIPAQEDKVADSGAAQTGRGRSGVLLEGLEKIPKDQREVLVLRHLLGLAPVEIADILNKTESSVNGLHDRGRRNLQASLVEHGALPVALPAA